MKTFTAQIDYHSLVNLGLSDQEAKIYIALLDRPTARPSQMADNLGLFVPSVYRTLASLVDSGFVTKHDTSPASYQAVAPRIAITHFANTSAKQIFAARDKSILALALLEPQAHTSIELITGAKQWYELYCHRTSLARTEVLVISVGEQVGDNVRKAFKEAAKRGVKHRFLFHRYNKDNEAILKGWLKTGDTLVRHYPDNGYHLVVWDTYELAIVASNPDKTDERSGMFIKSPALANAMRGYFYSLWDQSLPITPRSFIK